MYLLFFSFLGLVKKKKGMEIGQEETHVTMTVIGRCSIMKCITRFFIVWSAPKGHRGISSRVSCDNLA